MRVALSPYKRFLFELINGCEVRDPDRINYEIKTGKRIEIISQIVSGISALPRIAIISLSLVLPYCDTL